MLYPILSHDERISKRELKGEANDFKINWTSDATA